MKHRVRKFTQGGNEGLEDFEDKALPKAKIRDLEDFEDKAMPKRYSALEELSSGREKGSFDEDVYERARKFVNRSESGSSSAPRQKPSAKPAPAPSPEPAPAPAAKADIPKSAASAAPESTGEDTSGPSNLDRILMGTGAGAGIAGIAGAAKLAQMRRAKQAAEMSKAAAAKFSQPQARQIATQTGAKKQPAEQVKKEPPPPAKDSADTASPRKSRNIFERKKSDTDTAPATPPKRPGPKKPEVSASDKADKSPRGRSSYRDDADVEFRRGGSTKAYASGGKVRGGGCEVRGKTRGFMR